MLNIKVVGGGCANCENLTSMCYEIVNRNNIVAEIEKITDLNRFADLGIMVTPGLLLNDKVVSSGKLPTPEILEHWIMETDK